MYFQSFKKLTSLVLGYCMQEGGGAGSHACLQQYLIQQLYIPELLGTGQLFKAEEARL